MSIDRGKIIVSLIRQSGSKLDKNFRDYFINCGLTMPQMAVLAILRENGGMRISDISSKINLTTSTTSGIIDRLEKIGLVSRIRDQEDRRVVRVVLTEKADRMEHDLHRMMDRYLEELFSKAAEKDLEIVMRGLQIFNTILDQP